MLENCRICCESTKGTIAKNLFESKQSMLLHHIKLLTGEWLTNKKNAPIYICKCCEHDLKVAAALRERCIKTQRILRNRKICALPILETIDEIKLSGNLLDEIEYSKTDHCTESDQYAEYAEYVLDCTGDEQVDDIKDSDQYAESTLDCNGDEQVDGIKDSDQYAESTLDCTGDEQVDDIKDGVNDDVYFDEEDDYLIITSPNRKEDKIQTIENGNKLEVQRIAEKLKISSTKQPMDISDRTSPEPSVKQRNLNHCRVSSEKVMGRSFICDQCGKHFSDARNLSVHFIRHSGIKKYECEVCKAKFFTAHLLKRHSLLHKSNPPTFACKYCDKTFIYNNYRLQHERGHFKERRFQCDYCDKKFYEVYAKKLHERKHKDCREFHCELCDQHFLRKTHLNAHYRTKTHKNKEQQKK